MTSNKTVVLAPTKFIKMVIAQNSIDVHYNNNTILLKRVN